MPNPITIGRIELATLQPLERGEQADLVRLSPIDRCERDYITIDIVDAPEALTGANDCARRQDGRFQNISSSRLMRL